MSRAREPFHHLRETLREALRRQEDDIRADERVSAPSRRRDDDGPARGPRGPRYAAGCPGDRRARRTDRAARISAYRSITRLSSSTRGDDARGDVSR